MVKKNDVWFVTGCSKGLGRAIAQEALRAGYHVVVTARRVADVDDIVDAKKEQALAVELDVTSIDSISAAVASAQERFGRIDVLVNNAGYGYFGAIEEGEDSGVRAVFETNVFAPVNLIKAVLPGMRERRHGHVINISSVGGLVAYPAVGYYHMTKFAIEGLSETLAKELSPFGVGVTVVEPGAFRTNFREFDGYKQPVTRIPAYADTAGKARDTLFANHGKQGGDPSRGARVIITAVEDQEPPVHLAIGSDALDQIRRKLAEVTRDLDEWEDLSISTDFLGPTPN
jgi:NAD(P)-dependent dehydrogenase (short-subunit alcohol dehydrogenase family)